MSRFKVDDRVRFVEDYSQTWTKGTIITITKIAPLRGECHGPGTGYLVSGITDNGRHMSGAFEKRLELVLDDEKKYQVRNQKTHFICLHKTKGTARLTYDEAVELADKCARITKQNYEVVEYVIPPSPPPPEYRIIAEVVYHPASVTVDEVNSR